MISSYCAAGHGRGRHVAVSKSAWLFGLLAMLALALFAGAARAGAFVDAALPDLKPEQKVAVKTPQPVQLLFQFQTKGAPNAKATKFVQQQVVDTVKSSGLFSEVSDAPTANGALLSVTINDAPSPQEMDEAKAKGFVTGATFFVVGSTVREDYICTIDYVPGPNAPKISASAKHAIYIQLGMINSAPPNAVKVDGGTRGAVMTMVRQIVSNPLNVVAADPGFQPAAAASTPATPAIPAPVATPDQAPAAPAQQAAPTTTPAAPAPTSQAAPGATPSVAH
ncbi:hypothetical protein [Phenylobacterium montanum]|uniref:Uncharacterized protein n=1 Tax=Phenylobacterium montanum TaxID=2823693 RepID=A0A975FWV1_9CAUL|nr:hypothetical protein [Caulobacter sp. S6]QUD86424.1 hypothetical protein KCG34_15135 [Caulobacter sp. S6]